MAVRLYKLNTQWQPNEILTSTDLNDTFDAIVNTQIDIIPAVDNVYKLGSSSNRWESIYTVFLYTGDIKLQNNWSILEKDEQGNLINGVRILNDKGEEVFKITEDGIYFKGKKLKLVFEE